MQVTIVIPTFNEAENLPKLVLALFSLNLPGLRVLVVDDNSPDGTGEIAESLARQYPDCISVLHHAKKAGLGVAYIAGFSKALEEGSQSIAQMDADFSHPPEKIVEMLRSLETCNVVLGSRYIPGGGVDLHWPAWRRGLSEFGNLYARTILRLPIHDATGGFRIWRREALLGMPLKRVRSNGYAFQVEMAYIAYRLGYALTEVPFYFIDRRWGKSKMSFAIQFEAATRVWKMLWEYRDLSPRYRSEPAEDRIQAR